MTTGLYAAAVALYAVSTALALAYVFLRREELPLWMWRLLGVALVLHAVSFGLRTAAFWSVPENWGYLPLHTWYGALSCLAFVSALVFWTVEGIARLNILGAFILPFTLAAAVAALCGADPAFRPLPEGLRSALLNVHPPLLMAAYTGFANAFGVGIALLLQERQIKSRRPAEICYRLPALEELERLQHALILVCFAVLSAGIALGILWTTHMKDDWRRDAKVLFTLVTWGIYAGVLAARFLGLRGRRATLLSMAAFLSLVATFLAGDAFSKLHGFLMGKNG